MCSVVDLFVHSSGPFGGPFSGWGGSSEPREPPLATALSKERCTDRVAQSVIHSTGPGVYSGIKPQTVGPGRPANFTWHSDMGCSAFAAYNGSDYGIDLYDWKTPGSECIVYETPQWPPSPVSTALDPIQAYYNHSLLRWQITRTASKNAFSITAVAYKHLKQFDFCGFKYYCVQVTMILFLVISLAYGSQILCRRHYDESISTKTGLPIQHESLACYTRCAETGPSNPSKLALPSPNTNATVVNSPRPDESESDAANSTTGSLFAPAVQTFNTNAEDPNQNAIDVVSTSVVTTDQEDDLSAACEHANPEVSPTDFSPHPFQAQQGAELHIEG